MIFYHGTDRKGLAAILREGKLHGERGTPSRCTYLTPHKEIARKYAKPYLLTVDYTPTPGEDNYTEGCDQLRVYQPILVCDDVMGIEHNHWISKFRFCLNRLEVQFDRFYGAYYRTGWSFVVRGSVVVEMEPSFTKAVFLYINKRRAS